jgi:hypothetical protein
MTGEGAVILSEAKDLRGDAVSKPDLARLQENTSYEKRK